MSINEQVKFRYLTNQEFEDLKEFVEFEEMTFGIYQVCGAEKQSPIKAKSAYVEDLEGMDEDEYEDFIEDVNSERDTTWAERLFALMDEKECDYVQLYKASGVDRKLFSKISTSTRLKPYRPSRDIAIKFCFGLKLTLEESNDFLSYAGYSLSNYNKRDRVFIHFLSKQEYSLFKVREGLDGLHLKRLIGTTEK